jgi:hypothetical protein
LLALKHGGELVLRLDDTDTERSRAEYATAIEEDLGWLGISFTGPVRQQDRVALYDQAAARLKGFKRKLRAGDSIAGAGFETGYGSTSRMIAETGIALLSCTLPGGIGTPGALLGEALVDRLRAHAEITFAVED